MLTTGIVVLLAAGFAIVHVWLAVADRLEYHCRVHDLRVEAHQLLLDRKRAVAQRHLASDGPRPLPFEVTGSRPHPQISPEEVAGDGKVAGGDARRAA